MTAKQYLNHVRYQYYVVKQVEREYLEIKNDILSIHASSFDEKVSGTKDSDLADKYIRLEKYHEKVAVEWDKLIDARTDAKVMIAMLSDDRQKAVLYARYINGDAWETIAYDMHYSWKQVFRIHGKALASFEKRHRMTLNNAV